MARPAGRRLGKPGSGRGHLLPPLDHVRVTELWVRGSADIQRIVRDRYGHNPRMEFVTGVDGRAAVGPFPALEPVGWREHWVLP